mmetsp:Transcript_97686/g.252800  ORF Transcript_97686/g.252800 Transcript_97686/m.252800 type:complete len:1244 (-) Transcript_97686:31-3762(-)
MASPARHATIDVEWKDIDLKVKLGKKENAFEKQILSKMSGSSKPGEVLAIMGPSGAGKTSLLNVLAARTVPNGGGIFFNGTPMQASHRRRVAYVHQQEMLLASLTPKEHLVFQCSLRMPSEVSAADRLARINESINMFGLEKCQDRLIGDVWGGISKNEKRRLCFATEVLTDPAVLFADEPTTGLDSAMAEIIVKYFKALAQKGPSGEKVNVVATIHQPSSHIFRLFDKLAFLIDGHTAYFGPAAQVETYLQSAGYPMPEHTPPAEFFMKLVIDPRDPEGAAARRKAICDKWASQEVKTASSAPADALTATPSSGDAGGDYNAPFSTQLRALMRRDFRMKTRSKFELKAMVGRCVILGLIFGLTFLRVEKNQTAVWTLNASIFSMLMIGAMNQAMGTAMGIPGNMATMLREHRNGAYSVSAIYLSKSLVDFPIDTAIAFLWTAINFWMIGFQDDVAVFLRFFLAMVVITQTVAGIGYLGGYMAPVPPLAMLVVLVNVMPQMLFGGLFLNLNSVPAWFIWLKTISIFKHGYQALMLIVWRDFGEVPCLPEEKQELGGACPFPDGHAVLAFYGVDSTAAYTDSLLYCLIMLVVYRILGLLVLIRRARPRQFDGEAPEDDTKGEMRAVEKKAEAAASSPSKAAQPLLSLEWRNLGLELKSADTKKTEKLRILSGCSGSAEPGELVAIMGPSGCGKTTLLKALADIGEFPLTEGEVLVNGAPWTQAAREHMAYMYQEELFFSGLTVREHLLFQGRLRAGKQTKAEQERQIDKLLEELGLFKCRSTLIGDIGSGISGGERRRLCFAAEMLMDPSLLLADEPTSGLDSAMARSVTGLLREVTRGQHSTGGGQKRTIIATIHQPSAEVFELFDKLVILVNGQVVYSGLVKDTLAHFKSLNLICPRDVSPPDFFMRCVATDAGEEEDRQASRQAVQKLVDSVRPPPALNNAPASAAALNSAGHRGSLFSQIMTLARREMLIRRRSKILFKAVIARTFIMAILISLLYFNIDHNQASVQSIMGAITMICVNTFMTAGFGLTQELPQALRPALRESRLDMYTMTAWFWAKVLGDVIIDTILPFLGNTLIFWCLGFRDDAEVWILFCIIAVCCSLLGQSWGYFCSMAGGRPEAAFAIFLLSVFPMFTFNGFMVNTNDVPIYFRWIEFISPFKYLFSQMSILVWHDHGPLTGCTPQFCPFADGEKVLAYFGIETSDAPVNVAFIAGFLVFSYTSAWACAVLRGTQGRARKAKAKA